MWWCEAESPSLEKQCSLSLEAISMQRYQKSFFQPATVWNHIQSSNRIMLAPQSRVYQTLPPEFRRERMEWPTSGPQVNPVEPLWNQPGCAVCAWMTTTTTLTLRYKRCRLKKGTPTNMRSRCQAGCVWFFHMLRRILIVAMNEWLNCQCFFSLLFSHSIHQQKSIPTTN